MNFALLVAQAAAKRAAEEEAFPWGNVAAMIGVVAAMAIAGWLLVRYLRRGEPRRIHHPGALFEELCRAHELKRPQSHLLRRVAAAHELVHPALLFVQPELIDAALANSVWQTEHPRLRDLRLRLFGESGNTD